MLTALTACDGANSASWRMSSNINERRLNNGFEINVGSASSGRRNQTFNLTEEQLSSINISSLSAEGEITLVISQNGEEDGTEIVIDISNFEGSISADTLSPGRIRFSLRFEGVRTTNTTITW